MAQWAYAAGSCEDGHVWWVARDEIEAMPRAVEIVRVKVGAEWRCARLDRSHAVDVEAQLLREVVASDGHDCPECTQADEPESETLEEPSAAGPGVQAAAITIGGRRMLVVLVPLEVVQNPGEADMLADDLRPRLGGVDVVLMGQDDDGLPVYHGEAGLLGLLADVPVERMPWKAYPTR